MCFHSLDAELHLCGGSGLTHWCCKQTTNENQTTLDLGLCPRVVFSYRDDLFIQLSSECLKQRDGLLLVCKPEGEQAAVLC